MAGKRKNSGGGGGSAASRTPKRLASTSSVAASSAAETEALTAPHAAAFDAWWLSALNGVLKSYQNHCSIMKIKIQLGQGDINILGVRD